MKNFKVFDGTAGEFDTREEAAQHRWALPGTRVIFPRFVESSFTISVG